MSWYRIPDSRGFGGGTDDAPLDLDVVFRVGGHERDRSEPGAYAARYHDIVPDERIVFTYDLSLGGYPTDSIGPSLLS